MTASSSVDVTRRRRRPARRRLSFFGVLGELLMTAGVLVLLFLAWQLWWNDAVIAGRQTDQAAELRQSWGEDAPPAAVPSDPSAEPAVPGDPVIAPVAALDTTFGNLYIPRYGEGWVRTIAEGVDAENVLDAGSIGHYPGTQMPGEVGNFAIAAHRSAAGGGMHLIDELQLGDAIYIETADGWYTYRFRNLEYVQPSEVQVIDPVPWTSDVVSRPPSPHALACATASAARPVTGAMEFARSCPRSNARSTMEPQHQNASVTGPLTGRPLRRPGDSPDNVASCGGSSIFIGGPLSVLYPLA